MIRTTIICALILSLSLSIGLAPVPHCTSHPVTLEGPLSLEEKITLHLDNVFSGYNLNLSIASNTSVARMTPKFQMINSQGRYWKVIDQHVEHDGNKWGKQSYILSRDLQSSISFSYASNFSADKVPQFKFSQIITSDPNVDCFGAALLLDWGLAIIDCMKTTVVDGVPKLQNSFHYLDLTSGNITKIVNNPMYVPYTKVTQRKLIKFHDPHSGFQYLLRGYISNGVTKALEGNTYFEIFSITDPYNIQIMKVVDRTYLHIKRFEIVDIKIYLGDIFVLDYVYGLYRLDILRNNDIVITGRFEKEGCSRFSVYSDDLEEEVIIALANSHAVYEVEWSDSYKPISLSKYSLIEHSHIKQLIINEDFVIVQSSANATNETNPNFEIDYTWIFSKGARTYTNAYQVIDHNSSSVLIDFNRADNRLYIVDENGHYLYEINKPKVYLELTQSSQVGMSEDLIIYATSTDPNSNQSVTCQVKTKINFVNPEDQTIYNETYETASTYSTNNPGFLRINLDNYVLGPNITYSITNESSIHEMPVRWIDKVNLTTISMESKIGNVIFFHTTVLPEAGRDRVLYYAQDSTKRTYVIECLHIADDNDMRCIERANFTHDSEVVTFTDAYFIDSEDWNYFYIMVFKSNLKQIGIHDYRTHSRNWTIEYEGEQEAEITSIANSNGYLYVLRGAAKTIDVYKLSECKTDKCKIHFQLNAYTMKAIGVKYFTPLEIVTDYNHPEVLFLRCRGSIVVVDIDNKEKITLLSEIIETGTLNQNYRIAINKDKLTIVSHPDIIHVYSLEYMFTKKEIRYERRLPLYNYTIQPNFEIEFSDFNDMVYVNAVDPVKNVTVILVYRTSLPTALSLYTQINLPKLFSKPSIEIEVSGFYVDYVNIKTNDGFTLYRVFEQPAAIVENVYLDYKFQLSFVNSKSSILSEPLEAITVNYPTGFNTTEELNSTLNNLRLDTSANYTWNDRKWFEGHITSYNFSCDECGPQGSKVHLKEHVENTRSLNFPAYDYTETISGGVAILGDLFRFHINGSVSDVINLPDQKYLERCHRVASAFHVDVIVSACQQLGIGINLYITSQSSYKPWTWGPYSSRAFRAKNLQIAGDIVMLTDTEDNPEYKFGKGEIYLYSLDLDNESGNEMEELEVIEEADLLNAIGYKKDEVYIGNSHLVFSWSSSTYRLYVTEISGGFFVVDFTHQIGRDEINIVSMYYVDMITLLEQNNLHMPYDAIFQAISLVTYKYNPHFFMESVIVTTKKYHNFEVTLVFDDDGKLLSKILHRVYKGYGFYVTTNEVKTSSGYVAMSYVLPSIYHYGNASKQIVAVYDTSDYENDHEKAYSERYMLGAFRFYQTHQLMYSFNTTYDFRTNGTRIGLVITCPYLSTEIDMWENSLSKNLTLELQKDFKGQDITFTPFSDFDSKSFKMHLINPYPEPDEEKTLIIIIIVFAALVTVGFAIYIFILVKNRKKKVNTEERVSLLTDQETIRQSVEPTNGQYLPPSSLPEDDSDSDDSEKEPTEVLNAKLSPEKVETVGEVKGEVVLDNKDKESEEIKKEEIKVPVENKPVHPVEEQEVEVKPAEVIAEGQIKKIEEIPSEVPVSTPLPAEQVSIEEKKSES